ncbi:ASCH domain-containing protein [Asticcacaulis sp. SL142]|uniref:ASCH domain-containing protein n=1 Tax=Asticcacaulis sp. SL142 TaxID=2995155 RepID=UPI00226D2021|nr:ASCH domain-containing protein [Asticcacaulis sp. SL142]WAC49197.1 ASCH domain-containing protein [Asticcacaulis sp. SL142]
MVTIETLRKAPALSIRQPWAELIAAGRKDIELRSWTDSYRGPVWLHTGLKIDEQANSRFGLGDLFTGGIIGLVDLGDIRLVTQRLFTSWAERHLDFSPFPHNYDLHGWILSKPVRLPHPHPCKGALKLFDPDLSGLSDEEIFAALSQFNE